MTNAGTRTGSSTSASPGARRPAPQARLQLDPRERRADADVDAAAEADVLGGVRAADVEAVGIGEDAWVAVGRAEEQRDLRAAGDRRRRPTSTPSSSTQRSNSCSGGSQRISSSTARSGHLARHEPLPLVAVAQQRADAVAERVHGRLVAGVEQHDDGRDDLVVGEPPAVDARLDERADHVVPRRAAPLLDQPEHVVAELGGGAASPTPPAPRSCRTRTSSRDVRPVEQVAAAIGRHAEQAADDRDRVRLGVVAEQVEAVARRQSSRSAFASWSAGSRSASTARGVNAAATSLRIRVCSGGSMQRRLQRSTSQNACRRGSSGSAWNSSPCRHGGSCGRAAGRAGRRGPRRAA